MIKLYDKDTGASLGTINDKQLQFLVDQLEEESKDDQDYYINDTTLDLFEEAGADAALMTLLRTAMTGREEMEIRWSKE